MSLDKNTTQGPISFDFSNFKFAIVQSVYHSDITDELKKAAIEVLKANKVGEIHCIEMPGAYELVYGSFKAIESIYHLNGIITLGCVIKGDTDHDIYINHAVAKGLIDLQAKYEIPIGFGLLTTNNLEQAVDRAGGKHGNKGAEVANAVLQAISTKPYKI